MSRDNRTQQAPNRLSASKLPAKDQHSSRKRAATPLLLQRAYADPASLTTQDVLHLQRTVGNRATIGILSRHTGLQAKLKLGPAGDQYEQEADCVAQQVVRQMARPQPVQRRNDEEDLAQATPFSYTSSALQRKDEPRPKMVFTKPGEGTIRQPKMSARTFPLLQRKSDDPDVTTIDWANATSATPSPPSAMGGVVFVVVGGITHVVKPSDQPAAALFGEKMLEDLADVETTQSKPVATDSAEGRRILTMLANKKAEADSGENAELKAAWGDRYRQASGAKYFLIQKGMVPANQFSKLMTADPTRILNNSAVLEGIGRTMAVDALTGNQDRFENRNYDNVFLTAENKIAAIDTDAVLQNYAKARSESDTNEVWAEAGRISDTSVWSEKLISGSVAILPTGAMMGPSSSNLQVLFERFDSWFDGFKKDFTNKQPELEQSVDWPTVKASVRKGVNDGITAITRILSDDTYSDVHEQFSALKTKYTEGGEDPNFDWQAFQVKATYLLSRAGADGSHDTARLEAAFSAKQPAEWAAEVRALGDVAPLAPIPAPPGKLSLSKSTKQNEFEQIYSAWLVAIGDHATRIERLDARARKLYADRTTDGIAANIAYRMLEPVESLVTSKRLDPVLVAYRKAQAAHLLEWDRRFGGNRYNEMETQIVRFRSARTDFVDLVKSKMKQARAAIVTRDRSAHSPAAPPAMLPLEEET
jgi:hypothetical protein